MWYFYIKNLKTTTWLIYLFFLYISIFIKVYKPVTNTLRFKKSLFLVKFLKIKKNFKFFLQNKAGRNNHGCITVFSKGQKKKASSVINSMVAWDRQISLLTSIFRSKRKLFSLQKHTTGSLSVTPCVLGINIGNYMFSTNLPKKFWINNLPGSYVLLKFLEKYNIFSNIYINGKNRYALSNGTFCQTIDYFIDFNLAKISLPSKSCIYVSGFSFVLLGRNAQISKKFCIGGKAGSNLLLGKKPKVRGVARNPVDHPHGGRTKTNQPEVSIWGWVAKRNK